MESALSQETDHHISIVLVTLMAALMAALMVHVLSSKISELNAIMLTNEDVQQPVGLETQRKS
jgi:ABC-type proline/glycine betaine transport system permease subunit